MVISNLYPELRTLQGRAYRIFGIGTAKFAKKGRPALDFISVNGRNVLGARRVRICLLLPALRILIQGRRKARSAPVGFAPRNYSPNRSIAF